MAFMAQKLGNSTRLLYDIRGHPYLLENTYGVLLTAYSLAKLVIEPSTPGSS